MTKKRKHISIRWQMILEILLVQIPFCVFFLYSLSRTVQQVDHQLARSQQNSLNVYRDALVQEIADAGTFLYSRCWGTETISQAGSAQTAQVAAQALEPLIQEAKRLLESNQELNSVTFCAVSCGGDWTIHRQADGIVENHAYVELLHELIQKQQGINEGWIIREVDRSNLMIRICACDGVYVMVTVNLNDIALKDNVYGGIPAIIVLSQEGTVLSPTTRRKSIEAENCNIQRYGNWFFAEDPDNGYRYQVVQAPFSNMTISMATRYQYDWTWMRILGVVLVGVFLGTLALGGLYLNRTFFRPLNDLVCVMESIGSGEQTDMRLPRQSREFSKISTIFQDMLITLDRQKIQVYENQIRAQRMETNALRLQIRRHFFLNCLKNIYAMANAGDMESVKKIILLLSVNLRYTLDYHQDAVELQKELQMCENYVNLQAVGQTRPPVLHTKVDPELQTFLVPPVSVLTMVENCCKYGSRMGTALEITVSATQRAMDNQRYVCIAIQDNGPGFRQEDLFSLNNNLAGVQEKGHVGVTNTMARIRMMYGESCEALFSNRGGARVEWMIPISKRKGNSL